MEHQSSTESVLKNSWKGFRDFWNDRFSFLQNYDRILGDPLPRWTSSDVEHFIATDPIHGPVLKSAREAANFGLTGSLIGAVSTAGVAWKYSKSLHGAALSFVAGGAMGWTFGQEVANHWFQLYRVDTMAAQVKFAEWWRKKCEERP